MMAKEKKRRSESLETEFEEVVARLLQTAPEELDDALARVRRKQAEVRKGVEQINRDIERGFRTEGKKFRL
jgi:hypothetical protein